MIDLIAWIKHNVQPNVLPFANSLLRSSILSNAMIINSLNKTVKRNNDIGRINLEFG